MVSMVIGDADNDEDGADGEGVWHIVGGTHWPQVGEEDGGGGRSGRDLKATIGTLREGESDADDDDDDDECDGGDGDGSGAKSWGDLYCSNWDIAWGSFVAHGDWDFVKIMKIISSVRKTISLVILMIFVDIGRFQYLPGPLLRSSIIIIIVIDLIWL